MKKFYVWGTGSAQSALIREAEPSLEAAEVAMEKGFSFGTTGDDWAVEVEATEEEIDEATRFDDAVAGYTEAKEGMLIGVVLTYTAHKKPIWRTYDADQESLENVINRGVSNPPAYRVLGPYFVSSYNEAVIKEAVRNDPYESVDLDDPRTWF